MAWCKRVEQGDEDTTQIPTTPTGAKPPTPFDDMCTNIIKKMVETLEEKLTSFEEKNEEWCQRQEDLVQKMLPKSDKQILAMAGLSEVETQTENDSNTISTQTDADATLQTQHEGHHHQHHHSHSQESQAPQSPSLRSVGRKRSPKNLDLELGNQESEENSGDDPDKKETRKPSKESEAPQTPQALDLSTTKQSDSDSPGDRSPTGERSPKGPKKMNSRNKAGERSTKAIQPTTPVSTEKPEELEDVDLIGDLAGKRTIHTKMEEVRLKWPFATRPGLGITCTKMDGPLSKLVKGKLFRSVTNALVFMNIMFIVLEAEHSVGEARQGKKIGGIFALIDMFFSCAFAADLCMRLIGERVSYFYTPDKWWNIMDFCLVSGDVFNALFSAVMDAMGKGSPSGMFGSLRGAARACRAGRVARTLRVFRSVSFFTLPREVLAAFGAVPFMIFIWFFISLFFAIIFMQATVEIHHAEDASPEHQDQMAAYFGSISDSLVSLLFVLLGAMDWSLMYNAFEAASPLYSFVFLIFSFFAIVAFMNSITAMCVQSCLARVTLNEVEEKLKASVKFCSVVAKQAEADNYNPLAGRREWVCTWGMLARSLDKPLVHAALDRLGLDLNDARGICKLMSHGETREVNMREFERACTQFTRSVRSVDFLPVLLAHKKIYAEFKDFRQEFRTAPRPKRHSSK